MYEDSSFSQNYQYKYQSPRKTSSPRKPIFKTSPQKSATKTKQQTFTISMILQTPRNETPEHLEQKHEKCGCEQSNDICQILMQTILRQAPLIQMKSSYEDKKLNTSQQFKFQQLISKNPQYTLPTFMQTLPIHYPKKQIIHLNNIIKLIGVNNINVQQFQCLSYIQYHTKQQYITYYIYHDLKETFKSKSIFYEKFQLQFENCIILQENVKAKQYFQDIERGRNFKQFLSESYDSYGANIIPICCYPIFMIKIQKLGVSHLINLLIRLITKYPNIIENLLKYIKIEDYRMIDKIKLNIDWNNVLM